MPPRSDRRQLACQGRLTTNVGAARARGLRSDSRTQADDGGAGDTEVTQAPDDERLVRLLAAAIVADLRRFPPAETWDIIAVEVKPHPPGSAA